MKKILHIIVWTAFMAGVVHAELDMLSIFSDHMVLQANQPVPVWGRTNPGTAVCVEFAGQKKQTTADETGKWRVDLDPLDVCTESRQLRISAGSDVKVVSDVLVGEVWLCSGQSNMHYGLNGLATQNGKPTRIADEILKADYPLIRQMAVYSGLAPGGPKDRVGGLWQICSPQTAGGFSGTAYFFARELFRDLNVPIGIIRSAWSGSPIQPWTPREALLNHEAGRAYVEQRERDEAEFSREAGLAKVEKWKTENPGKKVPGSIEMLGKKPSETSRYPSTLYNAMIAPLIPYAIRGVVWYQGESNDQPDESRSYAQTFPSMIQAWRTHWGQGDFPFYFVQLANFRASSDRPLDSDTWANVRESQLKTLALPHTGMAVAIDIGEEKDVHPRNKIEVGRRLALWALAKDYGKDVVCSGPIYDRAQFDGNRVVIHFRETDGGLMAGQKEDVWAPVQKSDEPLKRFQICGEDRKWVWADARITGRDTVEVWSESIDVPVAVRYAWASNPEGCNLYNAAGLPASPFRTDDEK